MIAPIHSQSKVGIIGAGAAGYFAAIRIKDLNPSLKVDLLEGTRRPLTKVKVSGGGRCNVTHSCFEPGALVLSYPRGGRELRGALSRFQPLDTINWFKEKGVELHTEEDGRMFPVTNSSQTIIDTFTEAAEKGGVNLQLGCIVREVRKQGDQFVVSTSDEERFYDRLLLATGGSPGGFALAKSLGHNIIDPKPSLFTFCVEDSLLTDLAGQSVQECGVRLDVGSKTFKAKGPVLVTHWGLSGPAVLRLSAYAARDLFDHQYRAKLSLDFAPDLNLQETQDYLIRTKAAEGMKLIANTPLFGMSKRFWQRWLSCAAIEIGPTWQSLTNKACQQMAELLKSTALEVRGKGEFKSEFVTAGGVDLKEVNMKTLESKLCPGLFFSGEILNIDGVTGGFNFQNAWTTAWIAGQTLAQSNIA